MADVHAVDYKSAKAVATTGRREIDPANVHEQDHGLCWRSWQIRLPENVTLLDLNEHKSLWRQVQAARAVALRKFDHLSIIAYDETWVVEAIVGSATADNVILAGIRKIDLPPRYDILPQTDEFKVAWGGTGYFVLRKRDGVRVSELMPTIYESERAMLGRYARPGV